MEDGDLYARWNRAQERVKEELMAALESSSSSSSRRNEAEVRAMVAEAEAQYEEFYEARKREDAGAQAQNRRGRVNDGLMWIGGGWRPSVAVQLAYALAGRQSEAELADLLRGVDTPTLASLTCAQLSQISALQISIVKQEKELDRDMASLQQSLADLPVAAPAAEQAVRGKLETLKELSARADSLRLACLQGVLATLQTLQKAHFLAAAAHLHVALANLGKEEESAPSA